MGDRPEARPVGHASLRPRLLHAACWLAGVLRPPSFWVVAYFCAFAAFPPTFFWLGLYGGRHPDSMLFYSAAQLALGDQVGAIFDPDRMTDALNGLFFPAGGAEKYRLAPWLYPPVFLLIVVPFGLLSFGWFYGLFQAATAAAAAMAVGWRRGRVGWLGYVALLAAPATAINLVVGQNALLSIALLVGGFRLLGSYPWTAGALLGALIYKPQLCLLIPVALVAARAWRTLAAAASSALLLSAGSVAAFGLDAWISWLAELLFPTGDFAARWIRDSVMLGFGVYTCAARLGASPMLAVGAQVCAAAIAVAATYRAFRGRAPWELRLAVLLCGTALTTPHIAPYDLALVACAAVLMFACSLGTGFMAGEAFVMALAWVAPIVRPVDGMLGRLAPIWIAFLGGYAILKIYSLSLPHAPKAATA